MKKILSCLLLVILFSCPALANMNQQEYVEGEVLVVLDAPEASAYSAMGAFSANSYSQTISYQAEAFASLLGLEAINTYSEIASISGSNIIHLRSAFQSTEELIEELSTIPDVKSVSPNYIVKLNKIPNDQYYSMLWGMNNIRMPQVWDYSTGSDEVVVAVLDTGIDYNHQDLNANMARDSYGNYGRYFKDEIENGNPMDTEGHGTHVAGIIGAIGNNTIGVVGVNWRVKLLAVNVIPTGRGNWSDIAKGINYVVSEKNKGLNIRVANMSFGGWGVPLADNSPNGIAVRSLSDAGIICAIAACNENQDLSNPTGIYEGRRPYPACFRFANTITVGAITNSNTRSSYSNYGSQWVDIAAPGENIYSTYLNNSYAGISGTSMAAPHVAGAAALLIAAFPNETTAQIKARILDNARNIGVPTYWRKGLLDVWDAYAMGVTGVTVSPKTAFVTVGGYLALRASVTPANATNKNVTWSSSNTAIATVNAIGIVTGVKTGSATITTRTVEGGYADTCTVTVDTTIRTPTVETYSALNVQQTTATMSLGIITNGGASITDHGFNWGTSSTNLTTKVSLGALNGTGIGSFLRALSGLNPNTTYYFRAYATNSAGTAYGSVLSFRTLATMPSVTTKAATSVTSTGATINGEITNNGGASITDHGFNWGTSTTNLNNRVSLGAKSSIGGFLRALSGLTPNTTYYFRAYATNSAGTAYGTVLSFRTSISMPSVTTKAASSITSTGVTLNGEITSNGGGSITDHGFDWGTSTTNLNNRVSLGAKSSIGTFLRALSGLAPNTTYYFRTYATNSAGAVYGPTLSFRTLATMPSVTTKAASSITSTGATINGEITNIGGGGITGHGFDWGISTTNLNNRVSLGAKSSIGTFLRALSGLAPNTTYYFRAYATNSAGTAYGSILNFRTLATIPLVTTRAATGITSTGATINGEILSIGGASITGHGFDWGTSSTNLNNRVSLGAKSGIGAFLRALSGLAPNTTYYFRAYATNSEGTAYGSVLNFRTSVSMPSVTTKAATGITSTGATINGEITNIGGGSITGHGFDWGTSSNNLNNKVSLGAKSSIGAFLRALSNLAPNTTYYFRAYATNSAGTTYGSVLSFRTSVSMPTVTTKAATGITSTGATINGEITNIGGGSITGHGFDWGTSSNNLNNRVSLGAKSSIGAFLRALSGLAPNTTYYFRAYATNSAGTAYGSTLSFRTLP